MNISITFRHMDGSDAVKAHVHEKFSKLQKFLRQPMTANVTLSVEGLDHIADVNIASGSSHLHATERSEDMYATIDLVVDKLERQIREEKGEAVSRKRHGTSAHDFAMSAERAIAAQGRTRE